ncbi:MAG TPA: aldo/keto reductase [Candidatus Udaeobacter sp.]|nr:aldo/keto reductase [Candidatus Udaeobacter sp.]
MKVQSDKQEIQTHEWTPNRRELIKAFGLGAAAFMFPAAGLFSGTARAQETDLPGDLITRRIPRTNEVLPAIGLGTFMTFDIVPGQKRGNVHEVVGRFWQAGGRVFDTSPLYGMAEVNLGDFATSLGINDQMFVTNKIWSTGEYLADDSHAERSLKLSMERLWRDRIDVMQCHSLVNVDVIVPLMHAWKKEGRVRYVGVTHHEPAYFGVLTDWVERGNLDFVQVRYSIHTRVAEERLLPAAADRGVAVLVNMPLEKARLHKVVESQPVPAFVKELGIETWSQFFLKWVISHPAVTCALPATSNPDHLMENVGAMRGPLPDRKMRARMLRHMESIPGFDQLDQLAARSWYPGKTYPGLVSRGQAELRSRT